MHLILPLGFTLSPLLAWAVQWHGLTVLLAATILPLAEWWFGPGRPTASVPAWGKVFPRLLLILALLVSFGLASQAGSQSWTDLALLALSCGYVLGGIGIVLAHELGHRRSWADRALARLLLLSLTYGHYALEHNRGHYRGAATQEDPATVRQEEGLWVYLPRYLSGVFKDAYRLSFDKPDPLNETLASMAAS